MPDEDKIFRALTKCQKAIRCLAHPYRIAVIEALQSVRELRDPKTGQRGKPIFRGNIGLKRSRKEAPDILMACNDALEAIPEQRTQVVGSLRMLYISPPESLTDEDFGVYDSGWSRRG